VEELAWHAVEHGPAAAPVPATVHAVLAARMDRLPLEAKRLLQHAAVIGPEMPGLLLQRVAELPEDALQQSLAHLQATEWLYETRLVPERVLTFKHVLTHEVAYSSLLQERRCALHARVVEALEALYPDRLAEQVERLAHHAMRGAVWGKALTYCRQAGARAYDRAAFHEAVAHFDRALQALAHLPESGDTRVLALELRLALSPSLNALGEPGQRLTLLGEAETLARELNDRARLGQVLAGLAHVRMVTGDNDGAIAAGQQALALAAVLGESALQVHASLTLGRVYHAVDDFGRAVELLRWSVEAADREPGTPSTDMRITSRAWLVRTLSTLGAFTEARRSGEEALRLAMLDSRGATPILAYGCLGFMALYQGDLQHAIEMLEQGLALCRASGNRTHLRQIASELGAAYALQGRLAEGRALQEEAISASLRAGVPRGHSRLVARLSEVCRLAGDSAEAGQHVRQALALARQHREHANEVLALHQLGVVQAHADPPDTEAEAHYQQALALAEALGMHPLVAHCHLGLGRLYSQMGQGKQAHAALTTAIDLYRAMDMSFWLPQAKAALAQVEA
jgi:tetratricopeptide (TPR) repeat protein